MNQHYKTEYVNDDGFKPKLGKNDEIINTGYLPELESWGFQFEQGRFDSEALQLSTEQAARWLEPLTPRNGIRPPDLKTLPCDFVKIQNSDSKIVLFEVKDYPQENNFLMQGIPYRNARTYLAVQHLLEVPVFLLFRDNQLQEAGTSTLKPFTSSFKKDGKYLLYGGLLTDLYVSPRRSYIDERTGKVQIRWVAQQEHDGSAPVMHKLEDLVQMLKDGKIKKVKRDPTTLALWNLIQSKSDEREEAKLITPADGLVYFTTRE